MNLINQLKQAEKFTFNENIIVEYLLSHEEEFLELSIYDLAKQTNSSTSTIVRLSKKCGYSGFKEFKIAFARALTAKYQQVADVDANTPFEPRDTDLLISKKIAQLMSETVTVTQELLNTRKLNHSVDILLAAKNIYGIGVSDNYIRIRDLKTKLVRIGIYLRTIDLQAEQYHLAANATKEDVALLISYSGRTAEIVNDAKTFAQNGTPIVAITGDIESPLAMYATETLLLPNKEESTFKVSNFSSQIAVEYILNVLYSCIFNRNFEGNYSGQRATPVSRFDF
ncbi:MurR/RpiR family transcriptional regulator [Enterococcus sp. HY326]|uniref:MurR/RpiR family transcriptional regulator n=1 Tax=Enterococcus sp. HY326 TaxID=2971265 RepID=UPI002240A166|nr:MurR/RpiR family transcriptional regulator [Enterococcus sp. HY326]